MHLLREHVPYGEKLPSETSHVNGYLKETTVQMKAVSVIVEATSDEHLSQVVLRFSARGANLDDHKCTENISGVPRVRNLRRCACFRGWQNLDVPE